MKMQFDTGSSVVYILTDHCDKKGCGNQPKFHGHQSIDYREFVEGKCRNEHLRNKFEKNGRNQYIYKYPVAKEPVY